MQEHELVGIVLVAGLVGFLVGAGGWKPAYEQPLEQALPVIHLDRCRRAWIHLWMIPALFLTSAGVLGLAALADRILRVGDGTPTRTCGAAGTCRRRPPVVWTARSGVVVA